MDLVVRWLASALAIAATAYILPGVAVDNFFIALIVAVVLGLINAFVKPVLFFLTLPITIISLGLFTFVLNALLIMLAAFIVQEFYVENFWWALLFSLILSVVNALLKKLSIRI